MVVLPRVILDAPLTSVPQRTAPAAPSKTPSARIGGSGCCRTSRCATLEGEDEVVAQVGVGREIVRLAGRRRWPAPLAGAVGRRRWPAPLAGAVGRRRWPALLAGALGRRSWQALLVGALGRRSWQALLAGALGRRSW